MVEDIESFGPKLQLKLFANREFSPHGKIHLPSAKTPRKIPWRVSENGRGGKNESGWVDRSATRIL